MNFLLINPPIYDFAAYDLWSKPLGLLYLSAILKASGHKTILLDCTDRKHPLMPDTESDKWGCGHFPFKAVQKPGVLSKIPRKYKRYGLPEESIRQMLYHAAKPDVILVSSVMTYWYPGAFEIIKAVKDLFPEVPVILGGNYATLCFNHAKERSGADFVIKGPLMNLFNVLKRLGMAVEGLRFPFGKYPPPDYDQYQKLEHAALRTTMGCPFKCTYCAVNALAGRKWEAKAPERLIEEIESIAGKGVNNIAFYDDALLCNSERHIMPILKGVIGRKLKVNFHTPNGLHARYITEEVAGLLKETNFVMPRISLETSSPKAQRETGGKVLTKEYLSAVKALVDSGYRKGEFCAYTMIGMPGQAPEEVSETLDIAHDSGAHISLGEYSPIPGTRDWDRIKYGIPSPDPLWTNNSIFSLYPLSDWPKFQELKDKARRLNRALKATPSRA